MVDPALSPGSLASEHSSGLSLGFQAQTLLHTPHPPGTKCYSNAGEGAAILITTGGRSLVEEVVLKLLEVTDHAIHLQSLVPGT